MDSNTSTPADFGASPGAVAAGPEGPPAGPEGLPAGLEGLAAAVAELAACDPDEHGDAALAAQVLALRRLADQLDRAWLRRLAAVDARGAAGAEHGVAALSTAGRLRSAVALLPAPLGAPTQLLDLGRATRLVPPALRRALAVRDGGCVADGCDRPAPWTDAHHLTHWLAAGRPAWTTWCCCAGSTTVPSTKAAGSSTATPAASGSSWPHPPAATAPHPPHDPRTRHLTPHPAQCPPPSPEGPAGRQAVGSRR
jgi:hypothetical protein